MLLVGASFGLGVGPGVGLGVGPGSGIGAGASVNSVRLPAPLILDHHHGIGRLLVERVMDSKRDGETADLKFDGKLTAKYILGAISQIFS